MVELSALGLAISTVVTVAEILRHNQLAEITSKSSLFSLGFDWESSARYGEQGVGLRSF